MMIFRFFLTNENTGERVEVEEPIGFDTFRPKLRRDSNLHGVMVEYDDGDLEFYEKGYQFLKQAYDVDNMDAKIIFLIEYMYEGGWTEFYSGNIFFEQTEFSEANYNSIKVFVGQHTPVITLFGRMDQKVDLDTRQSFDGVALTPYSNLGRTLQVPSKSIPLRSGSYNAGANSSVSENATFYFPFPGNSNVISEIGDASFVNFQPWLDDGVPIFLEITENPYTYTNARLTWNINLRLSWGVEWQIFQSQSGPYWAQVQQNEARFSKAQFGSFSAKFMINRRRNGTMSTLYTSSLSNSDGSSWGRLRDIDFPPDKVYEGAAYYELNLVDSNFLDLDIQKNDEFQFLLEVTTNLASNTYYTGLYPTPGSPFFIYPGSPLSVGTIASNSLELTANSSFRNTTTKSYMIHEALSRVAEAITDSDLTVKSDYYGRTDSNINPNGIDGIASLRCITNGMMIRNAKYTDETNPAMKASFQDLIYSLKAMDNIGMGIEDNKIRIEPWRYFYNNEVVFKCSDINSIKYKVNPQASYNKLTVGYKKWETEDLKGFDAYHSQREYNIPWKVKLENLEQLSDFIADPYAIETTRRRLAAANNDDWRYDDDMFIFVLNRSSNSFIVKQGANGGDSIIDSASAYNHDISPAANAFNWFSWAVRGIKDIDRMLKFGSGSGNIKAIHSAVINGSYVASIRENGDISDASMPDGQIGETLLKNELVEFSYPLSIKEFEKIKSNPHGLVEYNGRLGWINSLEHRSTEGLGVFELIPMD